MFIISFSIIYFRSPLTQKPCSFSLPLAPRLHERSHTLIIYIGRYKLSKFLKIFLIGCKIKHYLGIHQIFFAKSCSFAYFCNKYT